MVTLNINTKVKGVELPIENNKVTGLKTGIASITKDDVKQAGAKVGKLAKDVNLSDFTPYIDNINIGDFLVFKKNPTPGYLYGIKYIDITSNEYTWRIVDKSSSLLNNFAI